MTVASANAAQQMCECKWDAGKPGEGAFKTLWCKPCLGKAINDSLRPYRELSKKWSQYDPHPSTPISETQHRCARELEALIKSQEQP